MRRVLYACAPKTWVRVAEQEAAWCRCANSSEFQSIRSATASYPSASVPHTSPLDAPHRPTPHPPHPQDAMTGRTSERRSSWHWWMPARARFADENRGARTRHTLTNRSSHTAESPPDACICRPDSTSPRGVYRFGTMLCRMGWGVKGQEGGLEEETDGERPTDGIQELSEESEEATARATDVSLPMNAALGAFEEVRPLAQLEDQVQVRALIEIPRGVARRCCARCALRTTPHALSGWTPARFCERLRKQPSKGGTSGAEAR